MNLELRIRGDSLSIDGQSIAIPAELLGDHGIELSSNIFGQFLSRVVYLVAHKRVNYDDHLARYAKMSAFTYGDARYESLLKLCCDFKTWRDDGWLLKEVRKNGQFIVRKKGTELALRIPAEMVCGAPLFPEKGEPISMHSPCFRPYLSPGYLFIISPFGGPSSTNGLARVYLNCTPQGACRVLMDISRFARANSLRFHAKFRNNPTHYLSSDSGVIYLSTEDFDRLRDPLVELLSAHIAHYNDRTSYFTKILLPGVSMATEMPSNRGSVKSYGEIRAADYAAAALHKALGSGLVTESAPSMSAVSHKGSELINVARD
ncbi:T3SS effector HopA1 family protein [Xanthomonas oryzae]|uniref:T3SS effector HopA1 family protein n=1 Tax=Xanthomonas oryzae TaxID=347 RepID=UPI001035319E|nr:T3SS effector HopA1 family protein [Xanthomonas oryzae]QBH05526.1 hypothetical protein EYC57_22300 [Xanthomonas oryzae]